MNKKIIKVIAIILSVISIGSVVVGVVANAAPGVNDVSESEINVPLAEVPTEEVPSPDSSENQEGQTSEMTTRKIPSSKEPEEENTSEGNKTDIAIPENAGEDTFIGERTTISLVNIDTTNEKAGDVVLNFKNTGTNTKTEVVFSRETGYISSEYLPAGTYKISVARTSGYSKFKLSTKKIQVGESLDEIKITVAKTQVDNGFIKNFFKNNSILLILIFCVAGGYIYIKKKNEAKLTRD